MARVSEASLQRRRAQEQLTEIGIKIRNNWSDFSSWEEAGRFYGLELPPTFTTLPYDYTTVRVQTNKPAFSKGISPFAIACFRHQETVLDNHIETKKLAPIYADKNRPKFGKLQLLSDQQPVADEIVRRIYKYLEAPGDHKNLERMVLQDGVTGSGKTYVAAYVAWKLLGNHILKEHKPLPFFHILFLTTKSVQPTYREVLVQAGLGKYLNKSPAVPATAMINTYPELSSSTGQLLFYQVEEDFDIITEDIKVNYNWNDISRPLVLILDETQNLIRGTSRRTKIVRSLLDSEFPPFTLHFSATPYIRVNDAQTICLSAGNLKVNGVKVTESNWKQAMSIVTPEPHKASKVAAKRLRGILAPYILSFPAVKWTSKAINRIKLVDFDSPEDKALADRAMEDWLEMIKKLGKAPPAHQHRLAGIACGQYRKRVEPLRINQIVDQMVADHGKGEAPVLFCAFRRSIEKALMRLVNVHGVPRDKVGLIWGGRRKFRTDLIVDEGTASDLAEQILDLPPEERVIAVRKLKETIKWQSDAADRGFMDADGILDLDAQQEAQDELNTLGLIGNQSKIQRQKNIKAFQAGEKEFMLVTIQAGGTGLSLDQNRADLRPRHAYLSPIYNGREFIQALGRLVRRMTIQPEVFQDIYIMNESIESEHVAPLLDRALAAAREAANTFSEVAIMKAIMRAEKHGALRNEAQVLADADKDEAKLDYHDEEEDEEDEENNDNSEE